VAWAAWRRPDSAVFPASQALRVTMSWAGIVGILVSAFLISDDIVYPGWAAIAPVAATALVIASPADGRGSLGAISTWWPIRWSGELSYGIYLWHWPLIVAYPYIRGVSISLNAGLLLIVVTIALAALTKFFIEDPVRYRLFWKPASRILAMTAAGMAVFLVLQFGGGAYLANRSAQLIAEKKPFSSADELSTRIDDALALSKWPEVDLIPGRSAQVTEWVDDECLTVDEQSFDRCAYGDLASNDVIAVIGDSTAVGWMPGLRTALPEGWRLQLLTKAECPFADVEVTNWERTPGFSAECAEHRDWVLDTLDAIDPRAVIVSNSPKTFARLAADPDDRLDVWGSGLASALSEAARRVESVSVVSINAPAINPQACRFGSAQGLSACVAPLQEYDLALTDVERTAAESAGVRFVDTTSWFCSIDERRCPAVVDNTLVKADGHHLTRTYSARLGDLLVDSVLVG
ncbi:MAG: acyltransferase family protein, partial [Coriobacteriia bacterium]